MSRRRSGRLCPDAHAATGSHEAGWEDGTLERLVEAGGAEVRFWSNLADDLDRWGRRTAAFNAGHLLKSLTPDVALGQLLDRAAMDAALARILSPSPRQES